MHAWKIDMQMITYTSQTFNEPFCKNISFMGPKFKQIWVRFWNHCARKRIFPWVFAKTSPDSEVRANCMIIFHINVLLYFKLTCSYNETSVSFLSLEHEGEVCKQAIATSHHCCPCYGKTPDRTCEYERRSGCLPWCWVSLYSNSARHFQSISLVTSSFAEEEFFCSSCIEVYISGAWASSHSAMWQWRRIQRWHEKHVQRRRSEDRQQ